MNKYLIMLAAGVAAQAGFAGVAGAAGSSGSADGDDGSGGSSTASRPNVVFILADDLGYGDISPYGQQHILTPNLERLAAQGMVFTQAYAGCAVSAPSRASLMTGLHTGHTFIRGNFEIDPEGQCPMPAGTFTLGTLFQNAGYATGAFGKWGLGYPGSESDPLKVGFDEFFGYNCQRQAHHYYPDHLWSNGERVEYPENIEPGMVTYSQDIIHERALDFIGRMAGSGGEVSDFCGETVDSGGETGRPFFAYLAYTIPHAELCLPHDEVYDYYVELFKDCPEDSRPWLTDGDYGTSEHPMASFAAMVTRLDKYVGDILTLLEEKGILENTLIIFTSDNGPHREGGANPDFFNGYGPLRGCKRDLYEGGIRVPFIASRPGMIEAGSVNDAPIAFWDMLPTFADLLDSEDLPAVQASDGISILPALTGNAPAPDFNRTSVAAKEGVTALEGRPYLYWEFHELGGRQAIRVGDWKGIRLNVGNDSTTFELYNLATDIHEDHNLADEEPEISAQLQQLLDSVRTDSDLFNFGRLQN
ncbi:MAG: arylsulfatase [Bacteroidales bacterium]|nr:arylsulfatase [Bacteroidales bacterium]